MAIYFFDKNQTLIKIVPESATFEAIQTQELDDDSLLKDTLSVTIKGDEKLLNAEYMAVKSYTGNAQTFDMYRIVTDTTPDKSMSFTGMSLAPYELNGHILQDLRPANHSLEYTLNRVLTGTDWRLGYVDSNLSNVTTTFYYVSVKEALKELQSLIGCEFVFKVEISGQKITDKWIEVYKEMGNRTKKRFNYGTNALTVVRETNKADIYTALIGRGKGEEVSSGEDNASGQAGYGRKITFEDIEWSTAKGNPLNKPKGQYYLELPQATQVYGIKNIDGTMKARVGIVDFDDEEDKNRLINLTYQQLLVSSRPKVLFKTTVANIGATGIGDTVTIHRHDLNIHYQTRVRKIVRNKLNDNKTQIELGDAVVTASTKQTKQNNATIKSLNQEIEKVKADVNTSQTSADGKNTIFYGPAEPERQRTGDTWYRPHPSIAGERQMLVWNGSAWELVIDTSDLTSVSRAVEEAVGLAEEAKGLAVSEAESALAQAKADATAKANAIHEQISGEVNTAISTAEDAKALAVSEAERMLDQAKDDATAKANAVKEEVANSVNTAIETAESAKQTAVDNYNNAVAEAARLVGEQTTAFDTRFGEIEGSVSDVDAKADEAVNEINTAIQNAGFTSLDETIQNMNNLTTGAEQNAQQAITDASNAHDLAQTSISEAQTAQANSLDALGKADNALDGVSNLDIRVDDVEGELELKADNTYMTEDGELITLSNAITFNAERFSSDMSRIESRVESLAGEINLVVLRGSIENRLLYGTEVFPNAPTYSASTNVMGELIDVVGGESFALSKELTGADDRWRIVFYDENHNFISRFHPPVNTQDIMDAPSNAKFMWVSYPQDSKPQITRGTEFLPYRPNMADQMTSDEVVIFRNEYDEFADKTERRLTTIDSSDGRLATAELLITQTANGLALKADQTTVDDLTGTVSDLGTEFNAVAGQVSSKVWKTDIDNIEFGGRNYFPVSKLEPKPAIGVDYPNNRVYHFNLEPETDYIISTVTNLIAFRVKNGGEYYKVNFAETNDKGHKLTTDTTGAISIVFWGNEVDEFINGESLFQIAKGNKATDWIPALEDADAKINNIETEWKQTFNSFEKTVTGEGGINAQLQTLDNTMSSITDPENGRLSVVEQTASGLQSEVYNADGSSKVTQLANGYNILVSQSLKSLVAKNIFDDTSEWKLGGNVNYYGRTTDDLSTIYVTGSNPDTLYGGNRVQVESVLIPGRRYKITLDIWSPSNRYVSIGQAESSNNVRLTVGNTTKTYEVVYEASNANGFSIYFHHEGTYRIGNITVHESTAVSQSQISVLEKNIDLKVSDEKLLSRINVRAGNVLIQSGTNKLNVTTETTFIADATIKSAMIDTVNVKQITGITADFTSMVTGALTANTITSTMIKSEVALIDKIFANEALITRLTSNTIFASKIKAIEIDAGKITSGTIDSARIDAEYIVTNGLSTNVVESTHIKSSTGLIDKIFANEALINQLTSKAIFASKIKAIEIDASKITSGELESARIKSVDVVTDGLTADAIQATHIKAETGLVDKIFSKTAYIEELTNKSIFTEKIQAINISADKVTTGTLDASKVSVVNLDAESITANQAKLIQAGFESSSGGSLKLSGDQILSTASDSSQVYIQNGIMGVRNPDGATIGQIGYVYDGGSPTYTIRTTWGSHFGLKQVFYDTFTQSTKDKRVMYVSTGNDGDTTMQFYANNFILHQRKINFGFAHYINGADTNLSITGQTSITLRANESTIFIVSNNGTNNFATLHANLNMAGNVLTNTSDIRVKRDIVNDEIDSLSALMKWQHAGFNYINPEMNQDRQFSVIAQSAPDLSFTGEDGYLQVSLNKQVNMTSHALQQHVVKTNDEISQLKAQIASLQDELALLKGA